MTASTAQTWLASLCNRARKSGAFGTCQVAGDRLSCTAKAAAEPAAYRLDLEGEAIWVSLVMQDRWLSESIEADLVHSGDKIEELLDEELADQGYEGRVARVEHFRSDDLLFTFRSRLPVAAGSPEAETVALQWLLAYEACFSQLGDMDDSGKED